MCGIHFSVSRSQHVQVSERIKSRLCERGPDHIGQTQTRLPIEDADPPGTRPLHLSFTSTVLALRGDHLVKQPLIDPVSGSILCWNGEAWKLGDAPVLGNDGEAVLAKLLEASSLRGQTRYDAPLDVLRDIEGPFAFVFLDRLNRRIWYGRDRLGRRSLLARASEEIFALCSIADGDREGSWVEVEADGIYSFSITPRDASEPPAWMEPRIYPWCSPDAHSEDLVSSLGVFNSAIPSAGNGCRLEAQSESVSVLSIHIGDSLRLRLFNILDRLVATKTEDSRVAVLFSGGLDCTVLARMATDMIPQVQAIDLLNVAFENPRIAANLNPNDDGTMPDIYEVCPDRITGRKSFAELTTVCPERLWRFVAINIPYTETMEHRPEVVSLMHPHSTEMDLSISYALYFASRGQGMAQTNLLGDSTPYSTTARVLFSGLGADELFGGYIRHETAFSRRGYTGLVEELKLDVSRLGTRNLGRDDRIMCHWGREVRFPFLDENLVKWAIELPVWEKCDFGNAGSGKVPEAGKRVLRLLAERLGMGMVAREKKRAIQFGSRTAKMETGKTKGTHLIS